MTQVQVVIGSLVCLWVVFLVAPKRWQQFFMDWVFFPLLFLFFLAGCVAALSGLQRATCARQWQDSGFQHRWQFPGGCMISRDGKVWLPADSYREVQL